MAYILVLAENGDVTVDAVMLWMKYLDSCEIIRINEDDRIDFVNIEAHNNTIANFSLEINNTLKVESREIVAYWYRRGGLAISNVLQRDNLNHNATGRSFIRSIRGYCNAEWEHIAEYIHFLLKNTGVPYLNSFFDINVNKLINLEIAKKCGLQVPGSIISNNILAIEAFLTQHKKVIVKPVRSPEGMFHINLDRWYYSQPTNLFTLRDLREVVKNHKTFQPTLFQEYIEKDFEIRSYWMKSRVYSMAIFSQNNQKTKVDFRNYDHSMPNRIVPYLLPSKVEEGLSKIMTELDYNSGSVDIIYSQGVYTFLEVNTVGQLQWLSRNCNYYIEKDIAELIISSRYEYR